MKNLFLLETDKPSRVYSKSENYKLDTSTMAMDWYISEGYKPQHIYITSDEEIKVGDWFIRDGSIHKCFRVHKTDIEFLTSIDSVYCGSNTFWSKEFCKKIILTTDQDLIKDGVQKIDDEFLEWFVKNPSCEVVGITPNWEFLGDDYRYGGEPTLVYYPVIPQEKLIMFSKGEKYIQQDGVVIIAGENGTNGIVIVDPKKMWGIGHYSDEWNPNAFKLLEEPKTGSLAESIQEVNKDLLTQIDKLKQEILEEVDEKIKNLYYTKQVMNPYPVEDYSHTAYEKGFIEGYQESVKWEKEQGKNKYSEALEFGRWIIQNPNFQNDSSWSLETAKFNFEQFKKEMR